MGKEVVEIVVTDIDALLEQLKDKDSPLSKVINAEIDSCGHIGGSLTFNHDS